MHAGLLSLNCSVRTFQ